MSPHLTRAFDRELSLSRQAMAHGQRDVAFTHLERAHILGQRHFYPHLLTHWKMLNWGLCQRQPQEVLGQILRLFAVIPGSLFGWVPTGNTGGANISAFKTLPLPEDLQAILDRHNDE
eukprot:GHVR01097959.1.p1 GENE.GHVR01097959.1~~GHVR01097959.1.p1  ORF type:complete len:118 (+),score=5.10 GHVR01097959.1:136-489(+)